MRSGGRYCPNCGNSLSHGAAFCPNCGQDQSPNATIIGDAEATSSVPPDSNNMSMTQQTVPPQAGQGQQSKGRGVFAFVVLLLAVIVAVSGITKLIDGNLGGTLVCIVVTVLLWFGYKALSKGQ